MANQVDLSTGYYPNPTIGRALSNANIYVGVVDLDPEIVGNQKQISVLQEDGTTIQVSQPITTSAGGVPQYNGSPVTILVDGSYSIKVTDSDDEQIYYVPKNAELEPLSSFDSVDDLRAIPETPADGDVYILLGYDTPGDGGGQDVYWDASSTATDNNYSIFKATAINIGRWLSVNTDRLNAKNGGATGDGTTDDRSALANIDSIGSVKITEGTYRISSNLTLTNPVIVGRNAYFSVDTGVTLTISAGYGYEEKEINTGVGTLTTTLNTAYGDQALEVNTTGIRGTAVGAAALRLNSSGIVNTAFGAAALNRNTTGDYNVALGSDTSQFNSTGSYNTAIGRGSLFRNTDGGSNVSVGSIAMATQDSASGNCAVGTEALHGYNDSEMLDDPGFDNIATQWSTSTGAFPSGGWTDGGSSANKSADGTNVVWDLGGNAPILAAVGLSYTITYTIELLTVGSVTVSYGGVSDTARSTNGTFIFNLTAVADTRLEITPTNTSRFNMTGISLIMTDDIGGDRNTAIGTQANYFRASGDHNTAIGETSLMNNYTGEYNIALGFAAGKWWRGDDRLFIDGIDRGSEANELTNALIVGLFDATPANQTLRFNGATYYTYPGFFEDTLNVGVFSATGATDGTTFDEDGLRRKSSSDTTAASDHNLFYNPNGLVGYIRTTGSTTAYSTTSDYRLKENDTEITNGIEKLNQLRPIRYNFKSDPGSTFDGFFAHEVAEVVPEAVHGEKDAVDQDGKIISQGLEQSRLIPVLTAVLQEAVAEIEALKLRLDVLESN